MAALVLPAAGRTYERRSQSSGSSLRVVLGEAAANEETMSAEASNAYRHRPSALLQGTRCAVLGALQQERAQLNTTGVPVSASTLNRNAE